MIETKFTTHIVTAPKRLSERDKRLLMVAQRGLTRDFIIRRPDHNRPRGNRHATRDSTT